MLTGKWAIVTGATRGIGKEISTILAASGANLILQGRDENMLNDCADDIRKMGREVAVVPGDVADPATADAALAAALALGRHPDILVNNAGMNTRSSTLDMTLADWSRVMDVNLNGTLHFCRAMLPGMIAARAGVIVNVSSTTAKTPHRNAAPAYGASKAAVNYLTMHLAQEMAPHGIRVNAVCPGPVESDMTGQWSADYRAATLGRMPLGRLGTPRNIADIVLFLVSDMSAFITGETINANGGTYMN
ncbi:SDR family NAD(P)-dependent oxidoreductase [Tropicibacter sp. S64]|uniref:SDR family NAD(P)-dependent oxidoreductase n=1 Tax=Tropicibacter sp. S64 TaxID=3415122 RepID=UPI003C7AF99B